MRLRTQREQFCSSTILAAGFGATVRTAPEVRRSLAREFGSVGQSGLNVQFLNGRVAADDFFAGYARSKVIENHGNHHARATDTRLSVTDCRVNSDALLPLGHASFYDTLE